jgi:MFS family permease
VIPSARGLRPLLCAEIVSTTGAAMTAIALPWLVLTTTGSPARAGLVAAAEWVPMALLGIPSGSVAARLGPRRTMILCDAARVPIVASVPLLHWAGALDFGVLLVLAFMVGAFLPAHFASQRTMLPSLLGEETDDITRANAVLQAANRLPLVLGPALGGVLVAAIGAPSVLLLDSASYAVSAVLLTLFVPERAARAPDPEEAGGLWAGVSWLAKDRVLRPMTVAFAGVELAMQALFLSLPILAFTAYDRSAEIAGLLLGAWGAGALAGALPAVRLASRESVALVRVALVAEAIPLWLVAAPLPPLLLGVGMALSGVANPIANAPANTMVTLSPPTAMRPKAMLAFLTASTTAGGIGLFLTGPAADAFGARYVILGAAALCTVCALGFALATRGGSRARQPDVAVPDIVVRAISPREAKEPRT